MLIFMPGLHVSLYGFGLQDKALSGTQCKPR